MKRIVLGIVAHVDSGKTTLSEALLFQSGSIRKQGRVDNKDAFLDHNFLERSRGITIFSKQAEFKTDLLKVTLLDTPGHVDFAAEMERTLQVLDYAVLVISGADGVQGHTLTLWRLLERYHVPVFIFINKMDQKGTDKEKLLGEIKNKLSINCIDFTSQDLPEFKEEIAMCDEKMLESFLNDGKVSEEDVNNSILERKCFPCFFGSALKLTGVEELLEGLGKYAVEKKYPADFGARIFKISRDDQGNRLTFMKVTGGELSVRDFISEVQEKVNQIRIYSGEKYETENSVKAGRVCAVTGLTKTHPGQGIGSEDGVTIPILEPVLTYQIILEEGVNPTQVLPQLKELEEEDPQLHIIWDEKLKEIQAQMMGEVQIEVLKSMIADRFNLNVDFGIGHIVYKETILNKVEGVGHFEPLRHYAEVHLILEPGTRGSGMQFFSDCSEDLLDKNWQRLVMTHLEEKQHKGVLTGADLTDVCITLAAGRAHQKHTEGGDFRQATYRAVRQGLMQAESILLEPWYDFRLEVPSENIGRAIMDIENMHGIFEGPYIESDFSYISGKIPAATINGYQRKIAEYSKGHGRLICTLRGYEPCHNMEEIVMQAGYDPESDVENTPDSVFCAHGAGFIVEWNKVSDFMHLESCLEFENDSADVEQEQSGMIAGDRIQKLKNKTGSVMDQWIGTEEVDAIISRTYHSNRKDNHGFKKGSAVKKTISWNEGNYDTIQSNFNIKTKKEKYLLVDGYNIIFAWQELTALSKDNIDSARGRLIDILSNYQGIINSNVIVVFDAYRVAGHETEIMDYHNVHVVYTKEAETADQYIEKFAHEHGKKYDVTVATSDGLEQIIIRGQGCRLMSARELEKEIMRAHTRMMSDYEEQKATAKNYLFDSVNQRTQIEIQQFKEIKH